jgi:hypothetical protein
MTDSTLFRTAFDFVPFYKAHPLVGKAYGDFHIEKEWTGARPRILNLGQDWSDPLQLKLDEFVPPADPSSVDVKGRSMYAVPWAIANPDAAVVALNSYIDKTIGRYMDLFLDDSNAFEWDIFHAAYRASVFPVPVSYDRSSVPGCKLPTTHSANV